MADVVDQTQAGKTEPLPKDSIIILPVRQAVLFPGTVLPLAIGRPSSIAAAQEAVRAERPLGVILQTDPAVDDPKPTHLHQVGTSAQVLRYVTAADGTHHVICQGVRRFRVKDFIHGYPYLVARVEEIGISEVMTAEIEARVRLLKERTREALQLLPPKCREVFVLSRVNKLTYQQIAETLQISVKTVENQMGKALKILRGFIRGKQLPAMAVLLLMTFMFPWT